MLNTPRGLTTLIDVSMPEKYAPTTHPGLPLSLLEHQVLYAVQHTGVEQ